MDKTELRLDPLTQAWTIFSESRSLPPTSGSVLADALAPSPFVGGLERYAPHTLHQAEGELGWQVRVVPNRMPVLRIEGDATRQADGFYDRMDGVGAHEVVVETPDDRSFERLTIPEIEKVITAWQTRILDLMGDTRLRSFSIIKDVGKAAGARTAHSLSQLVAMSILPAGLLRKLDSAREFFNTKHRSIFADILEEELHTGARLVSTNTSFVTFCPYAARAPFELAIWPRRQCANFGEITPEESQHLASALQLALRKLNQALDHPAYHLLLVTAPSKSGRPDHWTTLDQDFRWHIEIVPRLYAPTGLELATGSHVNGVWPETAATALRAADVRSQVTRNQ